MDQITVRFSVGSIIADNRMPFSINQGLELDAKLDNPLSFPNMIMTIAVLTFVGIKIDQEFSLAHKEIIQQDLYQTSPV